LERVRRVFRSARVLLVLVLVLVVLVLEEHSP